MKKVIIRWIKIAIFMTILIFILMRINTILEPTYDYHNSEWPGTSTFKEFYKLESDSVDVLFLGASVVTNGIAPQVIYDEYGIRSYNLSSEQQSLFVSYYWLKEALRTQSPKVVVLDTLFLEPLHEDEPFNMTEGMLRIAIDPMKMSSVKREAVKEICKIDESQSELSYYFTNIRFHDRWEQLTSSDFSEGIMYLAPLKGYYGLTSKGPDEYECYVQGDTEVRDELPELMVEYLWKIKELCDENDIELALMTIPGEFMYDSVYNSMMDEINEMGVGYYNFTLQENYDKLECELPWESPIYHANIWGAEKLSSYMGKVLSEDYGIEGTSDSQWDNSEEFYQEFMQVRNTIRIKKADKYLQAINELPFNDVTICFASDGKILDDLEESDRESVAETVIDAFAGLGFDSEELMQNGTEMVAVFSDKGKNITMSDEGQIETDDLIGIWDEDLYAWATNESNGKISIAINSVDYVPNNADFCMIIYDNNTQRVVDIAEMYYDDNSNSLKISHTEPPAE